MGRPPAYLFVVRHGYRLDAADKQWHLSSPAPYDPPLTYSGWQQCKNLGGRIASILQERVKEDELEARMNPDPNRKRKRYKVVLHSSPFLRCIQTSIAIGAGLAQDSTPFGPPDLDSRPPTPPPALEGRPRPPNIITDPPQKPVKIRKSVLRLDAFLGEWLSPTYFELITPPPESVMMLASAKSELLRREDYSHYPPFSGHHHSNSQGHLWSPTGRPSPASPPSDGGYDSLGSMVTLSNALPRSPSIGSQSSITSSLSTRPSTPKIELGVHGYVSPVPHYAVSNNNTIPPGYVAHAKDACVKVDYQWDSRGPPLDWGDGGSFPEEWASMHKRFRSGVQKLVNWYTTAEHPTEMVTKFAFQPVRRGSDGTDSEDDDVETEAVVIMVSHGAGCNALIGAITHQPVLMDVGMASLTMAVRKPEVHDVDTTNVNDLPPVHQLYDLKLFANSDHIRSPPTTPNPSRSPSVSVASVLNGPRGRHMSFSSTLSNFSWNDNNNSRGSSANMALNGLRRTTSNTYSSTPTTGSKLSYGINSGGGITVGSGVTSFTANKGSTFGHRPSIGLWSPISSQPEEDEDDDFLLPNFGDADRKPASSETSEQVDGAATPTPVPGTTNNLDSFNLSVSPRGTTERIPTPSFSPVTTPKAESSEQLGDGPGGLWGGNGPRPPEDADRLRDTSCTKRRWTVTERS
ncbi:uncharacterized protein PODANS_6_9370 [Podospora anserina S mat+]|uniref:Podospora anserina S mat+ genomic DNA chromosome 6, supercontig 4 n=1 Tax=Podospora anserina (strain S / ATCC MYA-4624 / DSM 980 / FGSC 10383) TaxID=515849 RepID=B2ANA0_PODAN|nr:uncharacterized protein PODANS_6_9370 [Podospora anserina S mat+]CAP65434.1 unnamed protein product [Podospora anserina S mat+]CDP31430.1 Putative protein of unknown function [Podospora anserina S mat+]